ncbi:MAG: phosphomannomutase/phosphoglucomutase, partial [Pseudomonadota bacterium]|nr:phosphomannomutase/phosphoglucomutase [Pseudomonadota bacterium]
MSAHRFHPTILRAYDIRGIFEDTLTTADAFAIGLSFISIQTQRGLGRQVAVGRDGRLSSPARARARGDGRGAGGAPVSDHGGGPTPRREFAAPER